MARKLLYLDVEFDLNCMIFNQQFQNEANRSKPLLIDIWSEGIVGERQ
jgi:hypothetical protein